jgi:hypothetical protein
MHLGVHKHPVKVGED